MSIALAQKSQVPPIEQRGNAPITDGTIFIVLPHLRVGGAQKQAILLAKRLRSRGHKVHIVVNGLDRDRSGRDVEMLKQVGGFGPEIVLESGSRLGDILLLNGARRIRSLITFFRHFLPRIGQIHRRVNGVVRSFVSRDRILRRASRFARLLVPRFRSGFKKLFASELHPRIGALLAKGYDMNLNAVKSVKMLLNGSVAASRRMVRRFASPLVFGCRRWNLSEPQSSLFLSLPGLVLLPRGIRALIRQMVDSYPDVLDPLSKKPSIIFRAYYLHRLISEHNPKVIFSFLTQTNLVALISTFGTHVPVIVSERNDVLLQPVSPHVASLRLALYGNATALTANGPHSVEALKTWYPLQNVLLMPNEYPKQVSSRKPGSQVIGMLCRLEQQKNVALVIEAFAVAGIEAQGWSLQIYGEGPEENHLEALIQRLGVEESVKLKGKTITPAAALQGMDFLISASDYEGSSNSIHEAVSEGVVPLAADTVSELNHILTGKLLNKLMFPLSVQGLAKLFGGLPDLWAQYDEVRQESSLAFRGYWDSCRNSHNQILLHAGLAGDWKD